jgi:hypothetical protein
VQGHDPALHAALGDIHKARRNVGERDLAVHEHANRTLLVEARQMGVHGQHVRAREPGGQHAHHGGVAPGELVGRNVSPASRGVADRQDPALIGQALDRALEDLAAHRVIDDVGALAVGRGLDLGHEVGGGVVDGDIGAERQTGLHLVRAAGRGDHPCAQRLGELDGGEARPARGAVHQHSLAQMKPRPPHEAHMGGLVGDGEGGGLHVAHSVRHRIGGALQRTALLGEGAVTGRRHGRHAHDLRADRRRGVGPGRDHLAHEFQARRKRHGGFQGIGAAGLQNVRQGQAAGDHPDVELSRARRREDLFAKLQRGFRLAVANDLPCVHGPSSRTLAVHPQARPRQRSRQPCP